MEKEGKKMGGKGMKRLFFLGLAAAMFLGCGGKPKNRLTLVLDWFPNADHVPIYVAKEKGFFADEGIDLKIVVPSDPSDPQKLVASGKADIGVSYMPQVVIARSEGLPVKSIGVLVAHPLTTILFLEESGIKKPEDLEGKRVGYSVPHMMEILFRAFCEKNGVDTSKIDLIHVGFNLTPSLLSGKVDAVIGAYRNYEKNEIELEGKKASFFPLEKYGLPDYYELVFITSEENLTEKGKLLAGFLRAMDRALKFVREKPEEALDLYFRANPDVRKDLDRKAFYDTLPLYAEVTAQDPARWKEFADFALKWGLISREVKPGDLCGTP